VAELADAQDLKSCDAKASCGFDPRPRHLESVTYKDDAILAAREIKINTLILLGAPIRSDYTPDIRNMSLLYNVYSYQMVGKHLSELSRFHVAMGGPWAIQTRS
jgi:hypothetical protein